MTVEKVFGATESLCDHLVASSHFSLEQWAIWCFFFSQIFLKSYTILWKTRRRDFFLHFFSSDEFWSFARTSDLVVIPLQIYLPLSVVAAIISPSYISRRSKANGLPEFIEWNCSVSCVNNRFAIGVELKLFIRFIPRKSSDFSISRFNYSQNLASFTLLSKDLFLRNIVIA